MKKIIFIREVFDWMGTHSAYDPLCNYIETNGHYHSFNIYRKLKPLPSSLRSSAYSFIHARINPSPFYNRNSLLAEVSAFKQSWKQHGDIVHIMYGENNYGILGKLKKIMPGKLVVTFHQTPGWWEANYRGKHLLSLIDEIIVVSQSQVEYFEQFLPGGVSRVPLGIDTKFFNPGPVPITKKTGNPRIVFSGHWMRDIKTLGDVVKNLLKHNPGIRFDFMVPVSRRQDEYFKELEKFPQVSWHSGLTDEELKAIYREASLLFIPYLNCTASCALLEAMACGLPIVSSRVGGIPEYTHPSFAELLPIGDSNGFTDAIINLVENPVILREKSAQARKYAEDHFAWDRIAAKTMEIYNKTWEK
ncbi:MAG TPA: glycosyltransferase family 4 protein [Candidatus Deferrimicrobium sp.]|nr:glycosyltransferase family 4 protein [Candidatus Deferrimicrobium sp.]